MKLKYIGSGDFLAGIPARDLSAEESSQFGIQKLIKSKLYTTAAKPQRRISK